MAHSTFIHFYSIRTSHLISALPFASVSKRVRVLYETEFDLHENEHTENKKTRLNDEAKDSSETVYF